VTSKRKEERGKRKDERGKRKEEKTRAFTFSLLSSLSSFL